MKQHDLLDSAAGKALDTAESTIRGLRADLAGQVRTTTELESRIEYLKQIIAERDRALGIAQRSIGDGKQAIRELIDQTTSPSLWNVRARLEAIVTEIL